MNLENKSTFQLIEELNLLDESNKIEAKTISQDKVGKSVYETICAFANEPGLGGGTILLGVQKEEALFPFYSVSGVEDADKISNDIASACQNKYNIPLRPKITREYIDKRTVVRIDVDELQSAQKPAYIKAQNLPRGAYRRIGAADIHCTQEDLVAFYQDAPAQSYDVNIIGDTDISDIDASAIESYRKSIAENNPTSEILAWTDEEILFGTASAKNLNDLMKLTTTGVLVFGRPQSLRRLFPTVRVDYIRINGTQWVEDPERRFQSIDMRGPLMNLINRLISNIADDLPKSFQLNPEEGGQRTEIPVIPFVAIREALVNALMHRNYNASRPIQVIRYSNRLVIENPGYSLKSQEVFDQPGSVTRNPNIAAILHETRFAETKGSGMRVMRQQLKKAGLSVPTFKSDRENDAFTTTFLFHQLLDENAWKWLANLKDEGLTNDQYSALVFVKETGKITNSDLRDLCGLDTLLASQSLRKLRDAGLLEKKGSGNGTYYEATEKLLGTMPLSDLQDNIQDNIQDTPSSTNVARELLIKSMPNDLRRRLAHLALGKRAKPEVVKDVIVEICSQREFSVSDIALMIDRDQTYVAQNYIAPELLPICWTVSGVN